MSYGGCRLLQGPGRADKVDTAAVATGAEADAFAGGHGFIATGCVENFIPVPVLARGARADFDHRRPAPQGGAVFLVELFDHRSTDGVGFLARLHRLLQGEVDKDSGFGAVDHRRGVHAGVFWPAFVGAFGQPGKESLVVQGDPTAGAALPGSLSGWSFLDRGVCPFLGGG